MVQPIRHEQKQTLLWLALLFGLVLSVMWVGSVARAEESEWVNRVETMPASGLIGEWMIGGRRFVTTNTTEFRQDKGAFAVGACVEVKFTGAAAHFTAVLMATKGNDD